MGYINQQLMKAFHNQTSQDGWFPVWDDKTNEYLAKKFGIYTDGGHIHKLGNSFKVKFDWNLQIFRVSA